MRERDSCSGVRLGKDFQNASETSHNRQIVAQLRKADVELGKGKKVLKVCKLLEVVTRSCRYSDFLNRRIFAGVRIIGFRSRVA